jgi:hypothetical protein
MAEAVLAVQLLKSPITDTEVLLGAYRLNITDLPAFIKVTPSLAPAGGSTPAGLPGTFPELLLALASFFHEVPANSITASSNR